MTRQTCRFLLSALLLLGLTASCGREVAESVRARNLLTGEIQSFFEGSVPPDWVVCESEACPIPSTITCETLGEKVCPLHPGCELSPAACPPVCEDDGQGGCKPCPAQSTCTAKTPAPCSSLDQKTCGARPDCEWELAVCPAICEDDGQGGCKPCPAQGMCVTKSPATCSSLDQKACGARPDCDWIPTPCPAICEDDGQGGCKPCPVAGACTPRVVSCPPIAPPPPGYCSAGSIVFERDLDGCMMGYRCELLDQKACLDLNDRYVAAVARARVCNPSSMLAVQECDKLVEPSLYCPICPTFVSIFASAALQEMNDLRAKWLAQGCNQVPMACPAVACLPPQSASCVGTGSAGLCTANP